jgi:2-polyprenyl-3-methyl-5-hydroxy-6-metoxy-1,4-benzoquinol methylase
MSSCPICKAVQLDILYNGKIRMGRFGTDSEQSHSIQHCTSCDAAWLEGTFFDYASKDYREKVDGDASIEDYYRIHDCDQARALAELGTDGLRGQCVVDIGCGGGAFLDLVKGFASSTIAIEPAVFYHEALHSNGHLVYSSIEEALEKHAGLVNQVVLFSVIEHVDDPVVLLDQARRLLRTGGRILLSTPNREDWLLELLPSEYGAFFYRAAHRWYFNAKSLRRIAEMAGFTDTEIRYRHRFGLANFLMWLRDRRPAGHASVDVSPVLDAAFVGAMNDSGLGDYIYAVLQVNEVSGAI